MKKILSIVVVLVTFFTSLVSAENPTENLGKVKVLQTQDIKINKDETVRLTKLESDGRLIYTVSGEVADKVAALEKIKQEMSVASAQGTCVKTVSNVNVYNTGFGKGENNTTACFGVELIGKFGQINSGGLHGGYYMGTGNADMIILNERFNFNGVSITVSWPPSFTSTGQVNDWSSAAVPNTWILQTSHIQIYGKTNYTITSIDGSEGAEIYKGGYIYRPTNSYSLY